MVDDRQGGGTESGDCCCDEVAAVDGVVALRVDCVGHCCGKCVSFQRAVELGWEIWCDLLAEVVERPRKAIRGVENFMVSETVP